MQADELARNEARRYSVREVRTEEKILNETERPDVQEADANGLAGNIPYSTHIVVSYNGVTDAAGNAIHIYKGQPIAKWANIAANFARSAPILAANAKLVFKQHDIFDAQIHIENVKIKTACNSGPRRVDWNHKPIERDTVSTADSEDRFVWLNIKATINGKEIRTGWIFTDAYSTAIEAACNAPATAAYRLHSDTGNLAKQLLYAYKRAIRNEK